VRRGPIEVNNSEEVDVIMQPSGEPPEFEPWRRKSDGNVSSGAASIKQDLLRQYCEKAKQWYQRELPGGGSAYRLVHLDTDDLFQELENG
jgi:hypothetical protein